MVPVQNPVKIPEDLRGLEVSAGRPVTVWILSGLLLGLQIRGLQGLELSRFTVLMVVVVVLVAVVIRLVAALALAWLQ